MTTESKPNLQVYGDRSTLEAQAARGEILRLEYGGVVWFEKINTDNGHAIKSPPKTKPAKDPGKPERRGRPRKIISQDGNRKPIPRELVIELKLAGLSGREVARELAARGYGIVSADYANRIFKESGHAPDFQQRGGRPRKGE